MWHGYEPLHAHLLIFTMWCSLLFLCLRVWYRIELVSLSRGWDEMIVLHARSLSFMNISVVSDKFESCVVAQARFVTLILWHSYFATIVARAINTLTSDMLQLARVWRLWNHHGIAARIETGKLHRACTMMKWWQVVHPLDVCKLIDCHARPPVVIVVVLCSAE